MKSEIIECCGENKLDKIIIKKDDKISSFDVSAVFVDRNASYVIKMILF